MGPKDQLQIFRLSLPARSFASSSTTRLRALLIQNRHRHSHLLNYTSTRSSNVQLSNSTLTVGWWGVCVPLQAEASTTGGGGGPSQQFESYQDAGSGDAGSAPPAPAAAPLRHLPHAYVYFVDWFREWLVLPGRFGVG